MKGRLIYLIGPSGSGKDSLLDAARERLAARGVRIARRVITRSAQSLGEDAQAVSEDAFERLEASGAFAMSWRANGLAYGIPLQIEQWLAEGSAVVVNGSRGYLPQARLRYPDLLVVLLSVRPEVLRQRLLARKRETVAQIEQRLARNARFESAANDLHLLDNSGDLELTAQKFLHILEV
ncbi:phosphonate metabolism protein/1,5-bisphosphokinase (PRPP-forming) PhnN [Stutzerimonas stutzeri]|uniref:phosphonate metabolism protein/1,5-bisphosphokinase (PRPP-forming) PhnN n=1 Tax=Stutzerimonas stutzeri TaxID=316 RepID=UPI0015E37D24|nr:phosphonate metabolism protein/1,5-bisphosphokinase (PRPP-forming) PhnN [Stutzerimonas stutzeri]MBA1262707.1 phosphonate metabolism protein/1,5-bisphosphokinase (PRPP-forming) PhnN [Stutzerimonas stutzeri]